MDRAEIRRRLEQLSAVLDADDDAAVQAALNDLTTLAQSPLVEGLKQATANLKRDMRDLDGKLSRAAADLPDVSARLNAVIQLTEDAANKTLDLVEDARARVIAIEGLGDSDDGTVDVERLGELTAGLRGDLMALAEAQSFQDLSGQIIKRVMTIVAGIGSALRDLLKAAGIDPAQVQPSDQPELYGPAVEGLQRDSTASQGDADSLLEDLGL